MFKLTEAADLEKAARSIGNFFSKQAAELEKTHAFHAALAAHHDAVKAAHTEHAAHYKAHHDGLPNDHEMKAHMAKGHTHHTQMAAHNEAISKAHGAHAETIKAEIDTMKSMAADWGGPAVGKAGTTIAPVTPAPGSALDEKIAVVTDAVVTKALEAVQSDPRVDEMIKNWALDRMAHTLGNATVPTNVSAVTPDRPGITMVPRGGAPAAPEKSPVPMEFEKLVSIDDEQRA